jgi:hypothetical protein
MGDELSATLGRGRLLGNNKAISACQNLGEEEDGTHTRTHRGQEEDINQSWYSGMLKECMVVRWY